MRAQALTARRKISDGRPEPRPNPDTPETLGPAAAEPEGAEPRGQAVAVARVITIGFRPGLRGDTVAVTTIDDARDGRVESLMDAAGEGIEATGAALVLWPGWDGRGIEHDVDTVRSLLRTTRLVGCSLASSPLGCAVVASLAAETASTTDSAGRLIALLPALEANVHTLAWLGSLRGLARPAPTMAQHLASWWPGTSFTAASWHRPALRRTVADHAVAFPPVEGPRGLALAADDDDGETWLRRAVGGQGPVVDVASDPRPRAYWGTTLVAEAAAYPLDPERLTGAVANETSLQTCPWCGEGVAASVCPFCHMALEEPRSLAAAVRT